VHRKIQRNRDRQLNEIRKKDMNKMRVSIKREVKQIANKNSRTED
jgi:hypothetical protein